MRNRSISDFPRNEAGLVDEFIGTAYDAMYALYINLEELLRTDDYAAQAKASQLAARASELAAAVSESNALNSQKLAALNAAAAAESLAAAINARDSAEGFAITGLTQLHEVQANALQVNTDLIEVTRLATQTAAIALQAAVTPGANLIPRADAAGHISMDWLPYEVARKQALDELTTKVTTAQDDIKNVVKANTATQKELDDLELDIDGQFNNFGAKNDATRGAALVGWDGQLLSEQLVLTKTVTSYAAIRAYVGLSTVLQLLDDSRSGRFRRIALVPGSYVDDGAYTLIGANGWVWRRINADRLNFLWWADATSADASAAMTTALSLNKPLDVPAGTYFVGVKPPSGAIIKGAGWQNTFFKPLAGVMNNVFTIDNVNAVEMSDFTVQGGATAKQGETDGLVQCQNGYYNVTLRNLSLIGGSHCGLVMKDGAESNERSVVEKCRIYSNKHQGIKLAGSTKHIDLITNNVHDNGHHGISLEPSVWVAGGMTPYTIDDVTMDDNRVYQNNGHGIYVLPLIMSGTSFSSFNYSYEKEQFCQNVTLTDNKCYKNAATGIMAGGYSSTYTANQCWGNGTAGDGYSGMVVAGHTLTVSGNTFTGNGTYGLDIGGANNCSVTGNTAAYNAVGKSFCIGINVGASINCTVVGNNSNFNGNNDANTFQMMIAGWDGDGTFAYDLQGGYNTISNNNIKAFANNYGIYIRRSAMYNMVFNNYISQTSRENAVVNETDFSQSTNVVKGNIHDISQVFGGVTLAANDVLVIDDYNDEYIITGTTAITSIMTKTSSVNAGKITAAKIGNPGNGYTSKPVVTITGGGGAGATATAEISRSGKVIGINITNGGTTPYTSAPTITLSGGGGTGATATCVVGVKNNAGRRITLQFEAATPVNVSGMNSAYTGSGGSTLTLQGRKNGNGQWVEISRAA